MIFEWLTLGFVLLGVRMNGSPLESVLGGRWRSIREFARDFGIGVAFLLVSFVIAGVIGSHGREADSNRALQFLFPVNGTEKMMWAALSLTAGICEEAIMRGYLQRQFTALTSSLTAGIILQALVFGAAHAYQGLRRAIPIAVLGVIWGVLAHWRKTVRPGMVTHALQDMSVLLRRH
jgi:membrane protease YdiL (CAAX protease family)